MSARPLVSVIVCSFNRSADLRLSLEAIFASTHRPLEVIVVDNASSDDAADVAASFADVKLIRNADNKGFAEANNQALAHASGDYVALVNNDAVVEPTWIASLVDLLEERRDVAAAGSKCWFWNDENPVGNRANQSYGFTLIDADTGYSHATIDAADDLREVATLSGAAVMIRRAAIDDVGAPFLDPIFFTYYEETDFFARALRKGWKLLYRGQPGVWHRVRGGDSELSYRYLYYMYRNRVIYAYRNFAKRDLERVLREVMQWVVAETWRKPLSLIKPPNDDARARRDAWKWLYDNRDLLRAQRASLAELGAPYNSVVRAVQSRADYYGHPRHEVHELIPRTAKNVLDVGCGGGGLGRALKLARPGIAVRGIEPVASAAERARTVLDDVMVGTADDETPASWPAPDCIVFADVLEHLIDPWKTLVRWRKLLAPGGSLVVSIPNVTHHTVIENLVNGRWDYDEAGVLDRTHLRFFTRRTAHELLEKTGFRVNHMRRILDVPGTKPYSHRLKVWLEAQLEREEGAGMEGYRSDLADVCTVQFLMLAH